MDRQEGPYPNVIAVNFILGQIAGFNPVWGMAFPMILRTAVGLSTVLAAMKLGFKTKGKVLAKQLGNVNINSNFLQGHRAKFTGGFFKCFRNCV